MDDEYIQAVLFIAMLIVIGCSVWNLTKDE